MPCVTDKDEEATKNKAREKLATATTSIEKLRYQVLARGTCGIRNLGRLFRIADDNGDKKLDKEEFKKLIHDCGVDLSEAEMSEIFTNYDKDNSGTLCFDEFLHALRPPMSESRVKIIHQCFLCMDATGDGVITIEDLRHKYRVREHPKYLNGEWSEEQVFLHFMKNFGDENADGKITEEEFLNYYSGVSLSIDSDVYFDLMMRNAYKIDGRKK